MTTTASTLSVITDGNTFSVVVRGVSLFTDAGLTVLVAFPQSVSADVTWYAAALTRPGVRQIEVLVTASDGTSVPVPTVQGLPATVDCAEGVVDYSGPASSGGSSSVTRVSIPFAFDTVGILVADTKGGIPVYTPAVGDILLNAIVSVPAATQFDGDYNLFMDTSSAVAAGLSALSLNNGLAGNADAWNGGGTLFSILEDMVITWAFDKAQLFTTTDALLMCLGNGITPPTQGAGVVTLVILSAP